MPTKREVWEFIKSAKDAGADDPYELALQEFSQPDVAVSTLRDVLGSRAFASFFVQYDHHAAVTPSVDDDDEVDTAPAPATHARGGTAVASRTTHHASARVLDPGRIREAHLDTYWSIEGKWSIKLRDLPGVTACSTPPIFRSEAGRIFVTPKSGVASRMKSVTARSVSGTRRTGRSTRSGSASLRDDDTEASQKDPAGVCGYVGVGS